MATGILAPSPAVWNTSRDSLYRAAARRALIMGILNVTPDSFSDGGEFQQVDAAVEHARDMIAAGAGIIDVGGESTRPGAPAVPLEEERRRVLPVIERLLALGGSWISVDTSKAAVARESLALGAHIVNDVTALRGDPEMAAVAADSGAAVVLMHMRGTPGTMQKDPRYNDVVAEVRAFLEERIAAAASAGIPPDRIAIDPGIGFGKTPAHNLVLLAHPDRLRIGSHPLLMGFSRKSFIGKTLGDDSPAAVRHATVGLCAEQRLAGVDILRVHDVAECHQAVRMIEALLGEGRAANGMG